MVGAAVGGIVGRSVGAAVGVAVGMAVVGGVGVLGTDVQVAVAVAGAGRATGVAGIDPGVAVGSTVVERVDAGAGTAELHAAASSNTAASKHRDVCASLPFTTTT